MLPTILELMNISKQRPILYTEHEYSNEEPLALLKESENQIDFELLKMGFDLFSTLGLEKDEQLKFQTCIKEEFFIKKIRERSDVPLLKVLTAQTWLAAPLLGGHANILSYCEFGGLEYDLEYNPLWKIYWEAQRFLESHKETLKVLKTCDNDDYDKNREWVIKNIRSITKYLSSDIETRHRLNELEWARLVGRSSWDVIMFSEKHKLPKSAVIRNELWANNLLKTLQTESDTCPLLLIVGNGHLAGYNQGWSFLSFLNKGLRSPLFRFSNERGWMKAS